MIHVGYPPLRGSAPNGEQVPAKIVQQPDGDYKVEYSSKYTGQLCLEHTWGQSSHVSDAYITRVTHCARFKVHWNQSSPVYDACHVSHKTGQSSLAKRLKKLFLKCLFFGQF